MPRRDRRSWGCRELKRTTRAKTRAFFTLYYEGFSRAAIASKLNMSLEAAEELFEVVETNQRGRETVATGAVKAGIADTVASGGGGVA